METTYGEALAAYEAARAAVKADKNPATMAAAVAASAALSALTPIRKPQGFACRAGQRQAAERRAMAGRRR